MIIIIILALLILAFWLYRSSQNTNNSKPASQEVDYGSYEPMIEAFKLQVVDDSTEILRYGKELYIDKFMNNLNHKAMKKGKAPLSEDDEYFYKAMFREAIYEVLGDKCP